MTSDSPEASAGGDAARPGPARSRRRILIGALILLLALLVVAALNGVDVVLAVRTRVAEAEFRRNYSAQSQARVLKAPLDWALEFGGRDALPRLDRLAADPALSPDGREAAAKIAGLIREGAHIGYVERAGPEFNGFARMIHRRIVEKDRGR